MKMKSIFFMSIISFAVLSCKLQYLGPDNALEEASKINFFVYQIHLPAANNGGPFQCPVIYDAINRSGGSRLGIRGIIDKNTIVSIANCLRQKPDTHVFLYAENVVFRGNDKRWPDSSFMNVQNLTGVYFPSTMQAIGNNAFDNCTSLEVIVLGPDFNTMYPRMLAGVKNLKHVVYYGSRLDFTGANNGDAWEGIPSGQMTLYLGNFDGYKETTKGGVLYTTETWAKYNWKEVYYKGEFNLEDIIEVLE
ncbi:leucine-rich repeat protein [Brachyspira alvinipulli]|uniref:leucine-rich repeat protein n=1 Tax=Brachyspira alvinipulli TaxID=84379 RepID=UPI0030062306